LWVELAGRNVLVVGGGRVGTRRALLFRSAGAHVKVVALEFSSELLSASKKDPYLELVRMDVARDREALRRLVEWADIVVIATDNAEANAIVWEEALKLRRWVNDATNADRTQIVVPYMGSVFDGRIKVAVTSEGRSGVAARHARDEIIRFLEGLNWLKTLLDVMEALKRALKKLIPSGKERMPAYFAAEKALLERVEILERGEVLEAARIAAEAASKAVGLDSELLTGELLRELGASSGR
jgi:precorrin-2 dehydrogenase/sirohydrochlorin ferrochelatase